MGIFYNPLCPRCNLSIEFIDHYFQSCTWSKQGWFGSQLNIKFNDNINFTYWLKDTITNMDDYNITLIFNIIDLIWIDKNYLVFKNKKLITASEAINQANQRVQDYHLLHYPIKNNPNTTKINTNITPQSTNETKSKANYRLNLPYQQYQARNYNTHQTWRNTSTTPKLKSPKNNNKKDNLINTQDARKNSYIEKNKKDSNNNTSTS